MRHFALLLPLGLLACGPVSLEQAERACFQRAYEAAQPRGSVGVGVGSGGKATGNFELRVSSDYIMGRDPAAVYDSCVMQQSGQMPSRPLYDRPDWRK